MGAPKHGTVETRWDGTRVVCDGTMYRLYIRTRGRYHGVGRWCDACRTIVWDDDVQAAESEAREAAESEAAGYDAEIEAAGYEGL